MYFESGAMLFNQLEWLANVTHVQFYFQTFIDIYEINFSTFTSWIFILTWVSLILPLCLLLMVFITSFFVAVYGLIYGLKEPSPNDSAWEVAKYIVCMCWHHFGRLWHGYEIDGLENVPSEGAALLVYYHGACPVDIYFAISDIYIFRNRILRAVVDRFMFKIPGWEAIINLLRPIAGSIETCTKILNEGHLMILSPGGVYEAQFSDSNYDLLWRNRLGFAKVAVEAKVPIIPVFTVNIREVYRTVSIGKSWLHAFYLKCRLPVVPIYGGYPVKLRTVIGKPIPYDPNVTVEELAAKTKLAIQKLIKEHQRIPGSIVHALLDRVYCPRRTKVD